ncbi:tumor necrosis factor receptor superfamily member 6-like [Seriola lalandi dorsalis]|uniref:tumor necrosis factor receptor superfamily member 6-like n=1 Tax=Seriola lalandi dorsalis TaxID=1841481 RepID=UPI000C6FB185|nr:tumor necrosis factor receptor superfamily member 6-like [Seriola lalandi dorsalis]
MQPLCYIAFTALCSLFFLSSVLSIHCNTTQYPWPMKEAKFCCKKCPPGQRMVRRSENSCDIKCTLCQGDRYIDSDNVDPSCSICTTCLKSNMEYKSRCNATHNAVCRCKDGYRCEDQSCTQCVPMPETTTPTLPPSTTTNMKYKSTTLPLSTTTSTPEAITSLAPHTPLRDTVWFLVIIALLCIGIALALATKIKPFLHWLTKHGYFLSEKQPLSQCSVDEDVSKPVQEVCGKCDQPIDV